MPWAVDLLLSLVVLLSTGVVLYAGLMVFALFMLGSHGHEPTPVWPIVAGLALLLLAGWTARGCRRLGYRITPWVTVAAPFLWPLGILLTAALLH